MIQEGAAPLAHERRHSVNVAGSRVLLRAAEVDIMDVREIIRQDELRGLQIPEDVS
jgi:hypothetical protein